MSAFVVVRRVPVDAGMFPRDPLRDTLQRKSDAPLKPAKPQAPCDHGLFGDDAAQLDLVDLTRKDK